VAPGIDNYARQPEGEIGRIEPSVIPSQLNDFLFVPNGEQEDETVLSVLSALAWLGGTASARGARCELARSRRLRSRTCDRGCADGPSFRRRERSNHRRSPWIQPGPHSDRTLHRLLSAELTRRGLNSARHAVYGDRPVSLERCVHAVRHSGSYGTFRADDVADPAAAATSQGGARRCPRYRRDYRRSLSLIR
jgi:hypothetical protein